MRIKRGMVYTRHVHPPHVKREDMVRLCEILQLPAEFADRAATVTWEVISNKLEFRKDGGVLYNRAHRKKVSKVLCRCECPEHSERNGCMNNSDVVDRTGTRFCDACAADAISPLVTDKCN